MASAHECDEDAKKHYLKFKTQAGKMRADMATRVSDVLESIANIHSNYNTKYIEALNNFEKKRKQAQLYDSATGDCYSLTLTHSLSLTHSLPLINSLTHSLTHLLTYSLTHSLTYSLTHSFPGVSLLTNSIY